MYWKDLLDAEEQNIRLSIINEEANIVDEFQRALCYIDIDGIASFKMSYIDKSYSVNKKIFSSTLAKAHKKICRNWYDFDSFTVKALKAEIFFKERVEKVLMVRRGFFYSNF